jgi:hypothetical protein
MAYVVAASLLALEGVCFSLLRGLAGLFAPSIPALLRDTDYTSAELRFVNDAAFVE